MKRKNYFKRVMAGVLTGVVGMSACFGTAPLASVQAKQSKSAKQTAKSAGEIALNPQIRYQTLEGWGTSLCWWGNIIGSWGDKDFNGNGTPDREEIAELAFSPEYLNLNIVRYNVGGGDKENTSIKRCEGLVPGWTEDMTGTKDGTGAFDGDTFYARKTEDMADAGQLWMLEQANAYRRDSNDIINEVFSNSPPYYMTNSGSSTGADGAFDNLKEDQRGAFASYLVRAAKWIDNDLKDKYGTSVDYIEPLNEPDTDYWQNGSTKQEGCIVRPGTGQSEVYKAMAKALVDEGLADVKITGTDETALWNAINSFKKLDDAAKQSMTTIGAHTYSGSDSERKELRRLADSYDKGLWMSEVTKGGGSHWDGCHNSMDAANTQSQSEGIMADLKYMQSDAWVAWLVADSEYECLQTDSNWGLLHAVFEADGPVPDYHTNLVNADGTKKEGVPEQGYWAITKQFYTMMQYSKYLKAGYHMIDIDDGNMCAAIAPDGSELVVVAQNFGEDRNTTVDLSMFDGAASAEVYQTSDAKSCEKIETQDVTDGTLDIALPAKSVTTYVVKAADGKSAVCDINNYAKTVDADVVKGADWVSGTDKFAYEGEWGESGDCEGKYTTKGGTATFTFEGERALLYGTKGNECGDAEIIVDGKAPQAVTLKGEGKSVDTFLFDTGKLGAGTHTVKIANAQGAENQNKLIELEKARIVTGELAGVVDEVKKPDCVYTVSGIIPVLPNEVTVVTDLGETQKKAVTWNINGVNFAADTTLEGTVEGTGRKASVDVKVVPENMVYVVDCNNASSPSYAEVDAYADLLNRTADQKYTQGAWGYVDDYGQGGTKDKDDEKDIYWNGWYAKTGQTIQYTFPLKAGEYKLDFGFREWWDQNRPMKIVMTINGNSTELGAANSKSDSGNNWNTVSFDQVKAEADGPVTFEIRKASDNDPDPVLSFIKIQKKLNLADLKKNLKDAASVDRSLCSEKSLAALDQAVEAAHPLLYKAATTQEDIDNAAKAVKEALDKLGVDLAKLTANQIRQNDYVLYTVNCGTSDASVLPNPESERWGLLQSEGLADQTKTEDPARGFTWGRDGDTENSKMLSHADDASDIGNSFVYMAEDAVFDKYKSQLGYSFQVPDYKIDGIREDTYEVTVAFKHKWDARQVNICMEGETVATDVGVGYDEWVSKTFTVKVTDGELNVAVKAPRRTDTKGDPILNYIKVRAVEDTKVNVPKYDSFTGADGAPMYDNNGVQIQAHGGQIQKFTVDGKTKWYWIGEDKTNDYRPVGGIHMYSSDDLYNWTDEGVVLRTMESPEQFETDEYFKNLYGNLSDEEKAKVFEDLDKNNTVMERPKILYNDTTQKYVIWFHCDGRTANSDADYGKAKAGIAIGDSPTGPFTFLQSRKLHNNQDEAGGRHGYDGWAGRGSVRDMNLFKDDDGTAYVIYSSEGNETTFIAKLNADYTWLASEPDHGVEGVGEDFTRNFEGWSREAPAMFKYNGKYYIINSGCSGWSPNQAQYFMADHPMGPYTAMGDPCPDWGSGTTYDTQSTCVIPVDASKGQFIYMGDRWFADNLRDSRYVWLPIEFQPDGSLAVRRYSNWKLGDLKNSGIFQIETKLPDVAESVAELRELLPDKLTLIYEAGEEGEKKEETPVTWQLPTSAGKIGTVTVTGTMAEQGGRTITHKVHIVNPGTLYFFDSGAVNAGAETEYFDTVKAKLGASLRNAGADQAYTQENQAGYLGAVEGEAEEFDLGVHGGMTALENGWWANADKNIEYVFELEPGKYTAAAGFQEWWNTQRGMKLTVSIMGETEETVLGEKDFTLWSNSGDLQIDQEFEIAEAGTVKVSISKTGSADPVLSWIGIIGEKKASEEVDKTVLIDKIAEAKEIQGDGYTKESFEALQAAIAEAEKALETCKTAEEAAKAAEALDTAIKGLETKKEIVSIAIADGPAKVEYQLGEELDLTGLKVKVTYTDKTTETIDKGFTTSGYDKATTGRQTITVTYGGKSAAFDVTVKETPAETVDMSALTAKINEAKAITADAYTEESFAALTAAVAEAEKALETCKTQDDVTKAVEALQAAIDKLEKRPERKITSVELAAPPEKLEYLKGEPLDTAGLTLKVIYDDGSEEFVTEITEDVAITGYDAGTAGKQEISVAYNGISVTFVVTVKEILALEDEETDVTVSVPEDTDTDLSGVGLKVEPVVSDEPHIVKMLENVVRLIKEELTSIDISLEIGKNAAILDIKLVRENEDGEVTEVQPEGDVLVTVPRPEGYSSNLKLFHNHAEGLREVPYKWNAQMDKLVFRVSEFSNFVIVDLGEEPQPVKPDKQNLTARIEEARQLKQEGYTADAWNVFSEALKAAEEVLADETASQAQVDEQTEKLTAAIEELKKYPAGGGDEPENPADKTALKAAVDTAKALDPEAYTQDAWKAFEEVLKAAEAVYADEKAGQETVDTQTAALTGAMEELKKYPAGGSEEPSDEADKSALKELLETAEGLKKEDYTEAGWSEFQKALDNAATIYADDKATQEQVDEAVAALKYAIEELKQHGVAPVDPGPAPDKPQGGNQGSAGDSTGTKGTGSMNDSSQTKASPRTSDEAPVVLWICIAFVSFAMIITAYANRRACRRRIRR